MSRNYIISGRKFFQIYVYTAIILSVIATLSCAQESSVSPPQIQTKSGPVEGTVVTNSNNQAVNIFYGIPYAQPPVDELRFHPPKNVKPWNSVFEAKKPSPPCYQHLPKSSIMSKESLFSLRRPWSEDCLTLNIWTPSPKPEKAPVIVFIHGGVFLIGSSVWSIDGTTLALDGVIVVTMNYRLGVFGFFDLGISAAPGNVGLMDQNLALRWVKDNIEAFGGDSETITLAGMSAGSASVGFQLLSPKSNGLFKRAILMSGVPTNPWAIREPEKMIDRSKSLLNMVGCPSEDPALALTCLSQKHPEDILASCSSFDTLTDDNFLPTVDGEFITEHPSVSVSKGNFNPGEVIIGSVADEGAQIMMWSNSKFFKSSDGRLQRRDFHNILRNRRRGLSEKQAEALNAFYTDWSNPDDPLMLRDAAKDMHNDDMFNCGINQFADSLAKAGNTVYRYVFDYKMVFAKLMSPAWMRAHHSNDQFLILPPQKFLQILKATPTDIAVNRRFFKHFTNFARHGDPNLSEKEFPGETHWPQYVFGHQYNHIRATSSIRSGYRSQECAVWLKLMPFLAENENC